MGSRSHFFWLQLLCALLRTILQTYYIFDLHVLSEYMYDAGLAMTAHLLKMNNSLYI